MRGMRWEMEMNSAVYAKDSGAASASTGWRSYLVSDV